MAFTRMVFTYDKRKVLTMINSYSSIYNLGHKALEPLIGRFVMAQEKVDGSQFSFGRYNGVLKCRSKGVEQNIEHPDRMFESAINVVKTLDLYDGWTYRAEFLAKRKHNVLYYDRVPTKNLILFDIDLGLENYAIYEIVSAEAKRLGLECVPKLWEGMLSNFNRSDIEKLLSTPSILGGTLIEGVVLKPTGYDIFGPDKKVIMAKLVRQEFKEQHKATWKSGPDEDIMSKIARNVCTEARWQKAIQHLRDSGKLLEAPQDIPELMNEVKRDVLKECHEDISQMLWDWAWSQIAKKCVNGLPEWYKKRLAEAQFSADPSTPK